MKRFEWQQRLDAAIAIFVTAFVGAVAVLLALWLIVAVALGTIELARRFA